MSKDSYWFKHDSTAGRGMKLRKIAYIYGHEGKGIYWDVIEVLREQDGYRYESDELSLKMLSEIIGMKDSGRFMNWFNDAVKFGLLENTETHFYSEILLKNMQVWETKKTNGSKGGRPPKNRNNNRIKSESKANRKHKSIEEKSIEDNSKPLPPKTSLGKGMILLKKANRPAKWNDCVKSYIEMMNRIRGEFKPNATGYKKLSKSAEAQLRARLVNDGYDSKDFEHCMKVGFNNEFHESKGYEHLTAEFFTREKTLETYLHREIKQKTKFVSIVNQPIGG